MWWVGAVLGLNSERCFLLLCFAPTLSLLRAQRLIYNHRDCLAHIFLAPLPGLLRLQRQATGASCVRWQVQLVCTAEIRAEEYFTHALLKKANLSSVNLFFSEFFFCCSRAVLTMC